MPNETPSPLLALCLKIDWVIDGVLAFPVFVRFKFVL
jgi:hypothetical protein